MSNPENRTKTGKFAPGHTGNAGGRPRLTEDAQANRVAALEAKARAGPVAVAVLVSILEDFNAENRDRIAACRVIMDGIEALRHEHTGIDSGPIETVVVDPVLFPTAVLKALEAAIVSKESGE